MAQLLHLTLYENSSFKTHFFKILKKSSVFFQLMQLVNHHRKNIASCKKLILSLISGIVKCSFTIKTIWSTRRYFRNSRNLIFCIMGVFFITHVLIYIGKTLLWNIYSLQPLLQFTTISNVNSRVALGRRQRMKFLGTAKQGFKQMLVHT